MYLNKTSGVLSPNAKLTESQVREIYDRFGESAKKLAAEYGVHQSVVYRIWKRRAYRWETK
jgi:DNA invertase Pin-like site-specific DNA recombinase